MEEMKSLTLNGKKYDSFPDQTARELAGKKLQSPASAKVGQWVKVAAVDEKGTVTATETEDAPETGGVSDEQIAQAVSDYLEENPVTAEEWPVLVPSDNGMKPTNTLTNARSIREKAVRLNAEGTKAHNLAMVKLGSYVFATWIEYTNTDYANGGSQCFERWAVLNITNRVATVQNWTHADNTWGIEVISSGTLFDGATITNGAISDASDACIFRLSDTKVAVMAEVTCGTAKQYACTAIVEFDSSYNATITYHEPTINGAFWDMKSIDPSWNSFYQFNNEPSKASATFYLPIVINGKGVQVVSTTDGIAFNTEYFVECEHAYLEASLNMGSASKFFMSIRSGYADGALYLACGEVSNGVATVNGKRKLLGMGSARSHIMRCYDQTGGGSTGDMPYYVFCCDANRQNGHLFKIRTHGKYGAGSIIDAVDVATWNEICTYPAHIDSTGTGNLSARTPDRGQLFGGTDHADRIVSVFPISIVDSPSTSVYWDGIDILASGGTSVEVVQTLKEGTEIGSVGGTKLYAPSGGGSWAKLGEVTTTEETTSIEIPFASRTFSRLAIYAVLVGTETNTVEQNLAINDLRITAAGAIGKTAVTKHARIMYDVTPGGSFIRSDFGTGNDQNTEITQRSIFGGFKSTDKVSKLKFTAGTAYGWEGGTFGVGTKFVVMAQ